MSNRTRLRSTTPLLVVSNLKRSIEFYGQALGFVDPSVHGDPPCFAMMNRDGLDLMLSVADRPEQVRPNGPDGVWDIYFGVGDIAGEIAALGVAGVALDKGPTDTFYQMREIEIVDPDGYRICLAQDLSEESKHNVEVFGGTLDVGSATLRLVLTLRHSQNGLFGSLDSLDQNAMNMPIDRVTRDGTTLCFEMKRLAATYEGTFSDDANTLTGRWSQRGLTWPLVLRRS